MNEETSQRAHYTRDALSATRMGKLYFRFKNIYIDYTKRVLLRQIPYL